MRIIHNTSFIVDEAIEKEWVEFMRRNYLETLRRNGIGTDRIFTKVSVDQPEGKTYSLQIVFRTEKERQAYVNDQLPAAEAGLIRRYAARYVCFSSVLTEI